ncbi:CGH_1_HP_G0064620.mRNA.1.CDS.1 [Saccharomyces cerevisiae]|nr:CGH_1_HP_G0064620.mRNA.1.CDS.1 [Saccharomyces cerevisiae]CAI6851478.1 CGH_1_HP_G0064620.mRNA.1.CDS.1 [Saccharomyces cerevisiae]
MSPRKVSALFRSDSERSGLPMWQNSCSYPVRCGTKLPTCNHPCIKVVRGESTCGHKPMPHTCHSPWMCRAAMYETIFKPCKCGKKTKVRRVWFSDRRIMWNKMWDTTLLLLSYLPKTCHLPGNCQKVCKQTCGQKGSIVIMNIKSCHGKDRCKCGRIEKSVTCGAKSDKVSVTESSVLDCNEECEALKRLKELKEAFGIKEETNNFTSNELDALKKTGLCCYNI